MSTRIQPRPWYCPDRLVEAYKSEGSNGGDLPMLKMVRAIESVIANVGVIVIATAALYYGQANSYVVLAAILVLGMLNGVLLADLKAIATAIVELSHESVEGPDDDS